MPRRPLHPEQATSAHSYRDTAEGWRMLREIADARKCSDGEANRQLVREAHARMTRRTRGKENDR